MVINSLNKETQGKESTNLYCKDFGYFAQIDVDYLQNADTMFNIIDIGMTLNPSNIMGFPIMNVPFKQFINKLTINNPKL